MMRFVAPLTAGLALLVLAGCGSGPGNSLDDSARAPREDLATLGDVFEKTPLPPGIKEFVFVDHPGQVNRSHLGACTPTTNDQVNAYLLTGWHLTNQGYTYRVNTSTFPASVGASAGLTAIATAFATWNGADSDKKFQYAGPTSVKTSKLDGTNLIAFGRLQAGVIAVTRVWYYTSTGIVAEADMIFNSRYPWAIFAQSPECQSSPDAYDLQNIATHEAGHVVGLAHPPDTVNGTSTMDLTMYRFGAGGEVKKRTLGLGDQNGANAVAP